MLVQTEGTVRRGRCLLKLDGPNENRSTDVDVTALVPPSDEGAMASPPAALSQNAESSAGVRRGRSEGRTSHRALLCPAQLTPSVAAASRPSPGSGIEGIACLAAQVATLGSAVTSTGMRPASVTTPTTWSTIARPSEERWFADRAPDRRCLPTVKDLTGITATTGTAQG